MMLPAALQDLLDTLAAQNDRSVLMRAAQDVSARYRRETNAPLQLQNDTEGLAYACARMPATYAAVMHVLERMGADIPRSMVDFGAGPGTASIAAKTLWPDLDAAMVEPNSAMRAIASQLMPETRWHATATRADLVIAAYVLNEMADPLKTAEDLWNACDDRLVIVDAGTPAASSMMLKIRDRLIALGAHIHAPCPHHAACPFTGDGGWCHFSVRLPRTRLHKALKGGDLGYEDEKFTYLVAGRNASTHQASRIIGHPRTGKVMDVLLCNPDGTLENARIAKRDPRYKAARKARWGDTL